jgi:hypothetical protein
MSTLYNKIIGRGFKAFFDVEKLSISLLLVRLSDKKVEEKLTEGDITQVLNGTKDLKPKQFRALCKAFNVTGLDIFLTGRVHLKPEEIPGNRGEIVDIAIAISRKLILNSKEKEQLTELTPQDIVHRFDEEEIKQVMEIKELALAISDVIEKFEKE